MDSNQKSLMCAFFTVEHNILGLLLVDCGGYCERIGSFQIHDTIADRNYDPLCRLKDLSHDVVLSYRVEGWDN